MVASLGAVPAGAVAGKGTSAPENASANVDHPTTPTTVAGSVSIVGRARDLHLPPPPPAPQGGPGANESGLVFGPDGTGFLLSGATSSYNPGLAAEIQETTDDGATWPVVWRARGPELDWIGTAGPVVVASGLTASGDQPLMVESVDQGRTWQEVRPVVSPGPSPKGWTSGKAQFVAQIWSSYRLHFVTKELGFAAPDPMVGQATYLPGELLRTTDGGRHWSVVDFPRGQAAGGLAFVSDEHGFATGETSTTSGCRGSEIWQTLDAGATWAPVPGTCVDYRLAGLSFPTPSTGFAVGGDWVKYAGYQQLDVLSSKDGGARWSAVYTAHNTGTVNNDGLPFADVEFVSPAQGYALDGGQSAGGNGPVGGHLWVTVDGGRHWAQQAVEGLRLVVAGPNNVWLVPGRVGQGGDFLWHSLDGGGTWAVVANVADLAVTGFLASGPHLWMSTEAGDFLSTDNGRSWSQPPAAMESAEQRAGLSLESFSANGGEVAVVVSGDELWVSGDGGFSGRTVTVHALAATGIASAAFADREDGLVMATGACSQPAEVLATSDGGSSWHQLPPLPMTIGALVYSGRTAVATGWGCGGNEVAISVDGGRQWQVEDTGNPCGEPSLDAGTMAVTCTGLMPSGYQYALVSDNDGRTWSWSSFPLEKPPLNYSLVVAGARDMWVSGPAGAIWHSTNGGATWQALRLTFPVEQ